MFAIESMVDEISSGVQVVENLVGVAGLAGSKHHHLELVL